jgi:hypothetical protein
MKIIPLFLAVTLLTICLPVRAQSLIEIEQFAQSICGDIPSGSYTKTVIEGKIKANVDGLAKLVVGSGSGNLTDSKKEEIYSGIPFKNLPDQIPTESMCKSELAKILLQRKTSAAVPREEVTEARAKARAAAERGREARGNSVIAVQVAASAQQRALEAQRQAASNGSTNGYSNYYPPNGDWYQGEFRQGRRNGYGVQNFASGEYYEGEFHDDQRDGYGVRTLGNGQQEQGLWRNNRLIQGKIILAGEDHNPFEGEWDGSNDNHGYGVHTFSNKITYEGEFRNFSADGYGVLTNPFGYRYEGMSHNGRRNGWGYISDAEMGYFDDGRLAIRAAMIGQ